MKLETVSKPPSMQGMADVKRYEAKSDGRRRSVLIIFTEVQYEISSTPILIYEIHWHLLNDSLTLQLIVVKNVVWQECK